MTTGTTAESETAMEKEFMLSSLDVVAALIDDTRDKLNKPLGDGDKVLDLFSILSMRFEKYIRQFQPLFFSNYLN